MRHPIYKILRKLGVDSTRKAPLWAKILFCISRPFYVIRAKFVSVYDLETLSYKIRGIKVSDFFIDDLKFLRKPTCWFRVIGITEDGVLQVERWLESEKGIPPMMMENNVLN